MSSHYVVFLWDMVPPRGTGDHRSDKAEMLPSVSQYPHFQTEIAIFFRDRHECKKSFTLILSVLSLRGGGGEGGGAGLLHSVKSIQMDSFKGF